MQILEHIDGNHQNHEVKNLRISSFPTCVGCDGMIERDRLKFLDNRKVPRTSRAWSLCKSCSFFERQGVPPVR